MAPAYGVAAHSSFKRSMVFCRQSRRKLHTNFEKPRPMRRERRIHLTSQWKCDLEFGVSPQAESSGEPTQVSNKRKPFPSVNAPFEMIMEQVSTCIATTQIPATASVASEERSMTKNPSLSFRVLAMLIALTGLLAFHRKRAVRRSIQLGKQQSERDRADAPERQHHAVWEAVLLFGGRQHICAAVVCPQCRHPRPGNP